MKHKMHVAWCWYIVAVFVLASVAGNTMVAAEEEGSSLPIDIAIDATYASAYYWRGASAGAGMSFMQPSVDISYAAGPVSVGANVWYSQGIDGGDADNSEIDYTLYVGASLGVIDISAGVIDYVIPGSAPFAEDHVLEANIGVGVSALPFDNSIAFYMNLAGEEDDSGDAANSMYLAPSLGTTYKNLGIGLTAGLVLGESALYGTEGAALVDITPSISYSIPGDAETAVSFNIGYNPNSGLKMAYVTLGTSFSID
jgi:hypothetical protein